MKPPKDFDAYHKEVEILFWEWYESVNDQLWTKEHRQELNATARVKAKQLEITIPENRLCHHGL